MGWRFRYVGSICSLLTLVACSQDARPLLLIQVEGLTEDITSIVVQGTIAQSPFKDERAFTMGLSRIGLRLPAGSAGPVVLMLDALADGCVVAQGQGVIEVTAASTYDLTIALTPGAMLDCGADEADLGMDPGAPDLASPDLASPDLRPVLPAVMVTVPGGTIQMGTSAGFAQERPVHSQTVATFLLEQTEVTVAQYRTCVETRGCPLPFTTADCNWGVAGRDDHPINCVNTTHANAYCGGLGRRLPTEIEWEYAARGTLASPYAWGSADPAVRMCWSAVAQRISTCPVGSFPKTLLGAEDPAGLADMAGNVWEWTSNHFCEYPLDGKGGGVNCDPLNDIVRGGSWFESLPYNARATLRYHGIPNLRLIGFRCAKTP